MIDHRDAKQLSESQQSNTRNSCRVERENDADEDPELSPEPPTVVVPDLLAGEEDFEAVRQQLGPPVNQLPMPSFRTSPISEFNPT
jgi:hypothetical protein